MKKLFGAILLGFTALMVSCSGSSTPTNTNLADNPSVELKTLLQLDSLTKGLNTYTSTDASYQAVTVAEDLNSTLFSYKLNLDSIFEAEGDRVVSVNAECLTFVSGISSDYQASLYNYLKDSTSGITKEKLGVDFDLTLNSWSNSVNLKSAYNAYNDGTRNQVLAIVYLPVHYTVVESSTQKLSAYVMVPVFYEITTYTTEFADTNLNSFDLYSTADLKIAEGSKTLGSLA